LYEESVSTEKDFAVVVTLQIYSKRNGFVPNLELPDSGHSRSLSFTYLARAPAKIKSLCAAVNSQLEYFAFKARLV
jgi:hypothetical protein